MRTLALLIQQEKHVRERLEEPPTPELLDGFMEWALQGVPAVVQQAGGVVAVVVVAVVVTLVVWKRNQIGAWWRHRGSVFKRVIVAGIATGILAVVATGTYVIDYVQHDNDFCNSCHLMQEPLERFQTSKHSQLSCHDCHRQSVFVSLRQVHLWVANRPTEVGPHAPVATGVCAECHVTEDRDSTWQWISATAGHRVHLESDTSALENVMCVTCHGEEVHRFAPVDRTCGQSGCHEPAKTEIVLGNMAGQTGFHCVMCHEFTASAAEKAPLDTARVAFVPALENCRSCHEMEKLLVGLDPDIDPHSAVCGTCHNPHTQETPAAAAGLCADCHAAADTLTPFHRGLGADVAKDCVGCHDAHTFRVDGDNCIACHADITGGTPISLPQAHPAQQAEVMPLMRVHVTALIQRPRQTPFDHVEHRDLRCTECHTSRETHGEVTIKSQSQCLECHHSERVAAAGSDCAQCHSRSELAAWRPIESMISIRGKSSVRQMSFDHDQHTKVVCSECHTQGIALRVGRDCASCHESHHLVTAACTACHVPAKDAHELEVHTRSCAGSDCHAAEGYGAMAQGRNTCLTCHTDMADHRPDQVCAACHKVSFTVAVPSATEARR